MFGQRRRLRSLAAQMLLVWLFAVVSGSVNACMVDPGLGHALPAAAHEHQAAAVGAHAHHAATDAAHDHEAPASQAACAKFCDDESGGVSSVRPLADLLGSACLAPLLTQSLAVQAALEPAGTPEADPGRVPAPIPVPIAYLRLTL